MITTLDDFIQEFTKIKNMGWIPTHRPGPTGIGKTLEDLLGIVENNLDEPDFGDYELKSCRLNSQSMLTLFTRTPQPARSNTYLRKTYGYSSDAYDNNEKVLHSTLTAVRFVPIANTGHKLKIKCGTDRISIASEKGIENVYWTEANLRKAFEKKYKNKMVYAKAESRGTGSAEEFRFVEAYEASGFDFNTFNDLLRQDKEVTPPDPKVNDPEPNMTYYSPTSVLTSVSSYVTSDRTSLSWKEWQCTWTKSGSKAYVKGFEEKTYVVTMNAAAKITPAKECPTATYSNATGKYTMKSGYGFEITVTNHLSGSGTFACTGAQHVNTLFPEFDYKTYNRLLEKSGTSFVFKPNKYSTYDSRVHFTPIRFRDNRYYNVYAEVFDVWCPAGSLSEKLTDGIYIKGNVYDDWHIGATRS